MNINMTTPTSETRNQQWNWIDISYLPPSLDTTVGVSHIQRWNWIDISYLHPSLDTTFDVSNNQQWNWIEYHMDPAANGSN